MTSQRVLTVPAETFAEAASRGAIAVLGRSPTDARPSSIFRGGCAETESEATPTAAVRHMLRALASQTARVGLREVKLLRPVVAEAQEALRERLEAGGSVEDYLRGRTQLADSVVTGLLHIASLSTGMRSDTVVAPFAAVATGGYGRRELAPGSDLDLLFLLPDSRQSRAPGGATATEACINAIVAGLWDLGFALDHAARSPRECLDLAHREPAVLASLLDRRFLWGGFGLYAALDADLADLFSGPRPSGGGAPSPQPWRAAAAIVGR